MRTKEQLVVMLEAAAQQAGKNKPLGIGTMFWWDMRRTMLGKDPDVRQLTQADILKTGKVGVWRDHDLYIISGNLAHDGLDNPRPWGGP